MPPLVATGGLISSGLKLRTFGSTTAFGHYGLGGSVGFGDAEAGIGFGYVMNKLELSLAGDPRTSDLIDAVYASLG